MYYSERPITTTSMVSDFSNLGIWIVISAVIALMGGLVIYFCFLTKDNEDKFTGKTKWLYDFLNFKTLYADALLKIAYVITVVYLFIISLSYISTNFLYFICLFVLGNIVARVVYEFALAFLKLCENTTEINNKMKENTLKPKEKIETKQNTKSKESK